MRYRLADRVSQFFQQLRGLGESRLADIEQITRQFLEEPSALEVVDREELVVRIRRGEVTIIDVRPREEYDAGHIPGAISIPLSEVQKRLGELKCLFKWRWLRR